MFNEHIGILHVIVIHIFKHKFNTITREKIFQWRYVILTLEARAKTAFLVNVKDFCKKFENRLLRFGLDGFINSE